MQWVILPLGAGCHTELTIPPLVFQLLEQGPTIATYLKLLSAVDFLVTCTLMFLVVRRKLCCFQFLLVELIS